MLNRIMQMMRQLKAAQQSKFRHKEVSYHLMHMNIEYKIGWLEHCLTLDCGKHYEDIEWQDHRD